MSDELLQQLNALARDNCYRADHVLKQSPHELTEIVYFEGKNGAETGPFVRKRIMRTSGLGATYERIYRAQEQGMRFKHLPRIIECHSADSHLMVIMENIHGITLEEAMRRAQDPAKLALQVFPSICDAVAELHDSFAPPIIHRDITPGNIIVAGSTVSLIDFGIARNFDEDADTDTHPFGTRAFAPPEQFGFGQTDLRSDVYALGMVLYYCLTGRVPTPSDRMAGFPLPAPLSAFQPVVAQATAFDPALRFQNARALKHAFNLAAPSIASASPEPATPSKAAVPPTQPANQAKGDAARAPRAEQTYEPEPTSAGKSPFKTAPQTAFATLKRKRAENKLSRPPRTGAGRLLSHIPRWLGGIWDAFLLSLFLLMGFGSVITINELESSQLFDSATMAQTVVYYLVLTFLFLLPSLYAVCDRRPLFYLLPGLAKVSTRLEVIICLAIFFATALIGGNLEPAALPTEG